MTTVAPPATSWRDAPHRSRLSRWGRQLASAASGAAAGEVRDEGAAAEVESGAPSPALSVTCDIPSGRRRRRWFWRCVNACLADWLAAQVGGDWSRVAMRRVAACGRVPSGSSVAIKVRAGDDGPIAYVSGTQTCGSVWACAVCSAVIRTRRAVEVQAAASAHVAAGGRLAMLTLTIRHEESDALVDQFGTLVKAWGRVQRRVSWGNWRRDDLVGTIAATEVTHGFAPGSHSRNGWHAHRHLLLFLPGGAHGGRVLEEMAAWIPGAWADAVEAECGRRPTMLRGAHFVELDADAAAYVSKVADELVKADTKTAHRQPFGLLDHVADGEEWAVARWLEYVSATKGRRALVWSNGLRDLLIPDVEELSDEELAALEVEGEVVQVIAAAEWWRLMRPGPDGVPLAFDLLEEAAARWRPPERRPWPPTLPPPASLS